MYECEESLRTLVDIEEGLLSFEHPDVILRKPDKSEIRTAGVVGTAGDSVDLQMLGFESEAAHLAGVIGNHSQRLIAT